MKRRSWFKWASTAAACLLAFVGAAYWLVTSSAFLKWAVVPKLESALHARIETDAIHLKPFSEVSVSNFKLTAAGATPQPLFQAQSLRLRYDLKSLFQGTPHIHELSIVQPILQERVTRNNASDWQTWLSKLAPAPPPSPAAAPAQVIGTAPATPPRAFKLENFSVVAGRVVRIQETTNGVVATTEINGLEFRIDRVANLSPAEVSMKAKFHWSSLSNNMLIAKIEGRTESIFVLNLDAALKPIGFKGSGMAKIESASGLSQDLAQMAAQFEADSTLDLAKQESHVRRLTLALSRQGQPVIKGSLAEPLSFVWSGKKAVAADATFELTLDRLRIEDWAKPFLQTDWAGLLSGKATVSTKQNGNALALSFEFGAEELKAQLPGYALKNAKLKVRGAAGFAAGHLDLQGLQAEFNEAGQQSYRVALDGQFTPLERAGKIQAEITLPATPRAHNLVKVAGRFNAKQSDAIEAEFSADSQSLDLTPWLPVAAPGSVETNQSTMAAAQQPISQEPPPMAFPLRSVRIQSRIDQLFCRDLAASNLAVTARISSNSFALDRLALQVLGAPIQGSGQIDFGMPGYSYRGSLNAEKVRIEPIANTFLPNYRDRYQGEAFVAIKWEGQGCTAPNIRNNLKSELQLLFTNANIHIVNPKTRAVLMPVAVLLRAPDLFDSPLNWIRADATMAQGRITINSYEIAGPALRASTRGTIRLAEDPAQSPLDLPIELGLRPSLARKSGFAGPLLGNQTMANETNYVKLPQFATLRGTVGTPSMKTDKAVIAGLFVRSAISIPAIGDSKIGNVLQGVGDLLTGEKLKLPIFGNPEQPQPAPAPPPPPPPAPNKTTPSPGQNPESIKERPKP